MGRGARRAKRQARANREAGLALIAGRGELGVSEVVRIKSWSERRQAADDAQFREMVSDTPAGRAYLAAENEERRKTAEAFERLAVEMPDRVRIIREP